MIDEPIKPSKHRLLQRTRLSKRKLFDGAAKARFLEVFAATANATMGAEAAGVAYQTVFKHRARDADFASAWEEALAAGFARLEAELLAGALGPSPFANDGAFSDCGPGSTALALEPISAGEEKMPAMTVEQKLAILREYRRGFGPGRRASSARPRVASEEEAIAALAERLAKFAVRGRGDRGAGGGDGGEDGVSGAGG